MPDSKEDLKGRVQQLLDHCELTNVRVQEFSAVRHVEHSEPTSAHLSSESSYLINEHAFRNRYVWEAELLDDTDLVIAQISATLMVEYEVHEGFEPDAEAADAITGSTGFFAAYPYVRELFQSSAARLQLDPLVLGMLMADSFRPRGVTIARPFGHDRLEGP